MCKKYFNGCLAAVLLLGSLTLPIGNTNTVNAAGASSSDISFEQANYGTLVVSGNVENPVTGSSTTGANSSWGYPAGTYYSYAKSIQADISIPAPNTIGASEYYVVMEGTTSTAGFGGNGVTSYTRKVYAGNESIPVYDIWNGSSSAVGASNYGVVTTYKVVKINGSAMSGATDAQGSGLGLAEFNNTPMTQMRLYWAWGSGYYETMKSLKYRIYRKELTPTAAPVITVSPNQNYHTGKNNTFTIAKPTNYANYQEQQYGILQYRVNGGNWTNYTEGTTVSVADEGTVKIESRLLTRDTLESPYGVAYSRQDNSPPSAPDFGSLDSNKWYRSAYDLLINAGQDDQSGIDAIYYTLDGAMNQPKSPYWMLGQSVTPKRIVADGITNVKATNRNRAGLESSEVIGTIRIDSKQPTASFTVAEGWAKSATIHAVGTDATSGMQSITLPNGQVVNGSSADYPVTSNGTYTFTFADVAGNSVTKSYDVSNIDPNVPTVALSQNGATWTDQPVSTTFQFEDAKSGININKMYYKWSQSTDTPASWDQATSTTETTTQGKEGVWYLHLRAYDLADNVVEFTSAPFQLQQKPVAPALVVIGTATDQMLLTWTLPDGDANTNGWKYTIQNEITGKSWTVNYPTNQLLDTSLSGGTEYRYYITATNHIGTASSTSAIKGFTLPTATVKADVYATGTDYSKALVSIDPVRSATSYHITATNWTTQEVDVDVTVTGNTYQAISGLKPYVMYDFSIRGINVSGEGAAYHTTFLSLPDRINGFQTVQIGTDTIALKWNTVTRSVYGWNSVTDDTYYPFWRDNQLKYNGTDPFFTDTGLSAGTEYNYAAAAANRTGEGTKAVLSNVLTLPSPPTNLRQLSATRNSATIGVSMPRSSDAIRLVLNGTTTVDIAGSKSSYTLSRLAMGTTYRAEVYARNGTGFSAPTTFIFTTLPDKPSASGIEVKSIEERAVTFHIQNLVTGATKYKLTVAGNDYELSAGDFTVTNLEAGTSYAYQLAAGNVAGYGQAIGGNVLTLPAAPTGYTVNTHTPTSINLEWTPVKSAEAYEVHDSTGTLIEVVEVPAYKATGLEPGAAVQYQVVAKNASGTGAASSYTFRTLPGFEDESTDYSKLVSVDRVNIHDFQISWKAVPGADQYRVYNANQQLIAKTTEHTTVINQLYSATGYSGYTVVPLNATGEGKAMPVPTVETLPDGEIALSYDSTRTSITLTLKHDLTAEILVIASQGQELYRGSANGYNEYMKDRLQPDATYTFNVWTENKHGDQSNMQTLQAKTKKERADVVVEVPVNDTKQPEVTQVPVIADPDPVDEKQPDTSTKKGFIDIDRTFAKASITRLADLGVVQGISEELYAPQSGTTRAEFMVMLTRLTLTPEQIERAAGQELTFTDLQATGWYMPELRAAVVYGIAKGFSAETFAPDQKIDREQAAKMLSGALYSLVPETNQDYYADASAVSPWAKSEVNGLTETNIVEGYPDQTFRPHASLTRAESAVMIDRAMQFNFIQQK